MPGYLGLLVPTELLLRAKRHISVLSIAQILKTSHGAKLWLFVHCHTCSEKEISCAVEPIHCNVESFFSQVKIVPPQVGQRMQSKLLLS